MFRTVRLTRVTIQCPEEQISPVMTVLGEMRLLHLIRIEETHLGRLGFVARVDRDLLGRYQNLLARISRLLQGLRPRVPLPQIAGIPRPDREHFRIDETVAAIEEAVLPLLEERAQARQQRRQNREVLDRLRLLEPAGLDFDRLADLRYVAWRAGLLPRENLDRLEESLADVYHVLVPVGREKDRVVLVAMTLAGDEAVLDRALKSAFLEPLALPPDLKGTIGANITRLTALLRDLDSRLAVLAERRHALAETYGSPLLAAREKAIICSQLLRAQEKFGAIDHSFIITGWLPVDLYTDLEKKIDQATDGRALVDRVDPENIREVRAGTLRIPILFNNPLLVRPFEKLTTLYGTPVYGEVEPTMFLAVSFLLLFGMMFGDVGQGAVLFAIGYGIFRRMFRFMDYGVILMECGVSSMVFGVLYGSVFGFENLIPALWMHPMQHIESFMRISVFLGIAIISLGFVCNLVNLVRHRQYGELLSASGLAGALLYWLLAGLGIRFMLSGAIGRNEILAAGVATALLFAVMLFQKPVRALLHGLRKDNRAGLPRGLGLSLFESLIEVGDEILRFMANTVSFVRVAAFGLTHAALFMAVFSLADMVRSAHGRGISYWLIIALGNVVIILLEGMVVSIQTLRLEYYEFFSRFFRGGGRPFRPILTGSDGGPPDPASGPEPSKPRS